MQARHWVQDRPVLEQKFGIHINGARDYLRVAMDGANTRPNVATPAQLTMYVDPRLIDILVKPTKAAQIYGEAQKGSWLSDTASFTVVETAGNVSSYGDFSVAGRADININFPTRQQFLVQTFVQWGEREQERAGLGALDLVNRLRIAAATTLLKWQNRSYFFGVEGLQNYGTLNDPNLLPSIQPGTKGAGGTGWGNATAVEVYNDILKMYEQLQEQTGGLVDMDMPLVLAMSNTAQVNLSKTNDYNVNVVDLLRKNFPNLRIENAPEFDTAAGSVVQLFVPEYDGIETFMCAFSEKLRTHALVVEQSGTAWHQKMTSGSWGSILTRPIFVTSMIGV